MKKIVALVLVCFVLASIGCGGATTKSSSGGSPAAGSTEKKP